MPKRRQETTRLERRMRHAAAWPAPKENPACERCRDAGWFILPAHGTTSEVAWRCDCAAGEDEAAPRGLPRWKVAKPAPARAPLPPHPPRGGTDRAAGQDDD